MSTRPEEPLEEPAAVPPREPDPCFEPAPREAPPQGPEPEPVSAPEECPPEPGNQGARPHP